MAGATGWLENIHMPSHSGVFNRQTDGIAILCFAQLLHMAVQPEMWVGTAAVRRTTDLKLSSVYNDNSL